MTSFQCRAVDLEMNACKKHGKHYSCTKGPPSFHAKVAEVKCAHNHVAEVEEEADERPKAVLLQKLGHRLFGLEIVPFLSYNTVCNLVVCLKGSNNEKIEDIKIYQRYLRNEKNRRLRALKTNCRLYLDASDKSSFQLASDNFGTTVANPYCLAR